MANDPTLDEVKAVLKRIQQLDVPPSLGEETRIPPHGVPVPPRQALRVFDAKYAATVPAVTAAPRKLRRPRWPVYAGSAALGLMALGAGVFFLWPVGVQKDGSKRTESPEANRPLDAKTGQGSPLDKTPGIPPSQASALVQARSLMSNGDVSTARDLLLKSTAAETPAGAFALAQSYDRNYLSGLTNPNGAADRAAAEVWYRRWYDLAIASGLKMDPERLSRIINAMK